MAIIEYFLMCEVILSSSIESNIDAKPMSSVLNKPKSIPRRQALAKEFKRLRAELDDLADTLDLLEARARNLGKPTYTAEEVRKRLGLKE